MAKMAKNTAPDAATDAAEQVPADTVPMVHPEGGSADAYGLDADGNAIVPLADIETMRSHGFEVVTAPAEAE